MFKYLFVLDDQSRWVAYADNLDAAIEKLRANPDIPNIEIMAMSRLKVTAPS